MSDESMLQALESTADQIDRLADIIDEFLIMGDGGVPMSATTRQKYAAEMAELRGHRAQLRKTIASFWVLIGSKHAQQVTANVYVLAHNPFVGSRLRRAACVSDSVCSLERCRDTLRI